MNWALPCRSIIVPAGFNRLDDPGGGGADAVEVGEDQIRGGAVEGDVVGAGKPIQSEVLAHDVGN